MIFMKIIRNGLLAFVLGTGVMAGCGGTDEIGVSDMYAVNTSAPATLEGKAIAFVVDTSSSMNEKLNGERKIESAKKSLQLILQDYEAYAQNNQNIKIGLLFYDGSNVRSAFPMQSFSQTIKEEVSKLKSSGGTPIGISLAYAERELDKTGYFNKSIVLLTDGENTVGKSPDAVFKSIIDSNKNSGDSSTELYIIAFDTDVGNFKSMKALGAELYNADNGRELSEVLKDNTALILEEPPVYLPSK